MVSVPTTSYTPTPPHPPLPRVTHVNQLTTLIEFLEENEEGGEFEAIYVEPLDSLSPPTQTLSHYCMDGDPCQICPYHLLFSHPNLLSLE